MCVSVFFVFCSDVRLTYMLSRDSARNVSFGGKKVFYLLKMCYEVLNVSRITGFIAFAGVNCISKRTTQILGYDDASI